VVKLKLLPFAEYQGVDDKDPLRYYYWPIVGKLYRTRVELALSECRGGNRILEIGFGSGITFLNLKEIYQEIHGLDLTVEIAQVQEVFQQRGVHPILNNGNVLNIPYPDETFDTVLLISILEHLQPDELTLALKEISRVLKPGGQVVYGVPVERLLMVLAFRLMGVDIRKHHFSTDVEVCNAAQKTFDIVRVIPLRTVIGKVYKVGHFIKQSVH